MKEPIEILREDLTYTLGQNQRARANISGLRALLALHFNQVNKVQNAMSDNSNARAALLSGGYSDSDPAVESLKAAHEKLSILIKRKKFDVIETANERYNGNIIVNTEDPVEFINDLVETNKSFISENDVRIASLREAIKYLNNNYSV